MAAIIASAIPSIIRGNDNPAISNELNELTQDSTELAYYDLRFKAVSVRYGGNDRMPLANRRGIIGATSPGFFGDYYNRIHLIPARIDLGTVASTISRSITVWNAYTNLTAELTSITVTNGAGISIVGDLPPFVFAPLQERSWEARVSPDGPPSINAQVIFDFDALPDPLPVLITGSRAIVLPTVPEVPVIERWKWLTDVQVAFEGTEQRSGLRRVPRRSLSTKLVLESAAEVREQYRTMLAARGRLFVPYFQYTTTATARAEAGDSSIAFDTSKVDVRDGDYLMVLGDSYALVQLDIVSPGVATTRLPLSAPVPAGALLVAAFPSIIPSNLSLVRPAVNNYGTVNLSSEATYPRNVVRPGATETLTYLDGHVVLDRQPLANEDLSNKFDTGQDSIDAKTGLVDVVVDWAFTRVETSYNFLVRRNGAYPCKHRTGTQEMDYWRAFADEMKGSLNNFLLSTHRPDQLLASPVGAGSDSMLLIGGSYVDNFWSAMPYHFFAIKTAGGVHNVKVLAASKTAGGDTAITFTPPLPAAVDFADVKQISYLLKQRIEDDTIELQHFATDTIININCRTVPE